MLDHAFTVFFPLYFAVSSPTPLCIQTEHEVRQRLPCKGFQIEFTAAHWIQTTILKHVKSLLPSPAFSFYQKLVQKIKAPFCSFRKHLEVTFNPSTHFNAFQFTKCSKLVTWLCQGAARSTHAAPTTKPLGHLESSGRPGARRLMIWSSVELLHWRSERCHCKVTGLHTNRASHFPWSEAKWVSGKHGIPTTRWHSSIITGVPACPSPPALPWTCKKSRGLRLLVREEMKERNGKRTLLIRNDSKIREIRNDSDGYLMQFVSTTFTFSRAFPVWSAIRPKGSLTERFSTSWGQ